jgi:hypothetical protein
MGRVFGAEHVRLAKRVALKVLLPQYGTKPDAVARFFNEARAVNQIGHDHIVEVHDDGCTDEGENYFVMEYLQGESLSERLSREGPLPPDRALRICSQVADALVASHQVGIVHRDLKPDNIFLIRGITRCVVFVTNCSPAPPAGTQCATSADCCGNPCIAYQCLAPGTSVSAGGNCTNTADCCLGSVCEVAPGSTVGLCGPSRFACALPGQSCGTCCNGVPCTGGRCRVLLQ